MAKKGAEVKKVDPRTWGAKDSPDKRLDRRAQQILSRKKSGSN